MSDKKDTLDNEGSSTQASRSNVTLRCGDCLHYKNTIHPAKGQLCQTMGVKTFAAAPPCYTANVTVFRNTAPELLRLLSLALTSFTPQQSRVFMGLLKSAGTLEKVGLTFMQRVYFNLGEDYLDNYYSGFALGMGVDNSIMVVGASYFGANKKAPLIAHLLRDRVIDAERFKKKRAKLIDAGLTYMPRRERKNEITDASYEPPTIETAQEVLESLAAGKNKKSRQKMGVLEVDLQRAKELTPADE